MDMQLAKKALDKAKIGLMSRPDSTFLTTLCFSMKHILDESIPTACTNGTEIRFNPDFLMSMSEPERVFVMVHEAMHVALLHITRRNSRDPRKWNIAADYVINGMLINRGFKMPACGLHDAQYDGMSTDQVYDLLPDNPPQKLPMEDIQEGDAGQAEQTEAQVTDILVRAQIQSRLAGDKPGTIPGDIEIFLDKLLNPKLPWEKLLRRYMNQFAKSDYTWKKPNRRFTPDYILPSLHSEQLDEIAIAVDTSGSVTDEEFKRFISEIHGILNHLKPKAIRLIQFDTVIHSQAHIKNCRELNQVSFHGRGGTRITEVIDWAEKNKPVVLLVFSDGHFRHSMTNPKCNVLWLIHGNKKFTAPYGQVIHYEI